MGSTYLNKDGIPVDRVELVDGNINIENLNLENDAENPLYVKSTNTEAEAIPVQLTGSNVEQRLFNALAITNIATNSSVIKHDLSKLRNIDFLIENTLKDAEGNGVALRFSMVIDGRPVDVKVGTNSDEVRPWYVTSFGGTTGTFARLES